MNVWYLDTSAFLKLVVEEHETAALRGWVAERDESDVYASCDLLRAEARRAARQDPDPETFARVVALLEAMTLFPVTSAVMDDAGIVDPVRLRTLDAIHLVAAQSLIPDLAGIVTYDERLASAATVHDIAVMSPGT